MDILPLLRCLACEASVEAARGGVVCRSCGTCIPLQGNALCFVPAQSGHPSDDRPDSLMVRVKNLFKRFPRFYMALVYLFGVSNAGVSPQRFMKTWVKPEQVVLTLGAGTQRKYPNSVHVDLYAFPEIDVVADIRNLPFQNESVDAVICQSVLEHIPDPDRVMREVARVLKPGGLCYLTVPFMFPYHSSPNDYARWTLDGLRMIAAPLKEEVSGLRHGPTAALALLFAHWLATIFSFGFRSVYDVIVLLGMLVLAPIAHVIDFPINRLRSAEIIASGYYFIARK